MISTIKSLCKELNLFRRHRQRQLSETRKDLSESEFVRQIADQGGDKMAAAFVWSFLKDRGYREAFTPYPGDDFDSVFGIDTEELEYLVIDLLEELKLPMPNQKLVDEIGAVNTPFKVALLVAKCRTMPTEI